MSNDQTIAQDVLEERRRQDTKWGAPHNQPDGTGPATAPLFKALGITWSASDLANMAKAATDKAIAEGTVTLADILLEEVFEALAELEPETLRAELVQVSAVGVKWVRILDERTTGPAPSNFDDGSNQRSES